MRQSKTNRASSRDEVLAYDVCQTPAYALDPLWGYLPRSWAIWECAAGKGNLVRAFRAHERQVIASDLSQGQNFLTQPPPSGWDCLVTNPPFSLVYEWLARCYHLGQPFALLLKVEVLGAAKAQRLFDRYGMELIVLNKRVNFEMPYKGYTGKGAHFPVAWFTWGFRLGREIVYGKIFPRDADQLFLSPSYEVVQITPNDDLTP